MAAAAACKRLAQLGTNSGISLTKFSVFEASRSFSSNSSFRQFSQLVKSNGQRMFLVDTLALVIYIPLYSSFFPLSSPLMPFIPLFGF